ncbi:MAG TPA: hypothetical protein VMI31_12085 [Fimbriimonadaceae bacterium]|nr:hypothetical protein [Fimbriimonadaceae bacterium]
MKSLKVIVFGAAVLVSLAAAHVYEIARGVHFKGGKVDFGEPPRRERLYDDEFELDHGWAWRPGTTFLLDSGASDDYENAVDRRIGVGVRVTAQAEKALAAGRYVQALRLFRSMNARGDGDPSLTRERIEVLKQGIARRDWKGLQAYVQRLFGTGPSHVPAWLEPYLEYDDAMKMDAGRARAQALELVATRFPAAPRAEPALMMAARDLLGQTANRAEPAGENLEEGSRLLHALLSRYPKTRFLGSALGWLARIHFAQRDFRGALALYWRQLPLTTSAGQKEKLFDSMVSCDEALGNDGDAAFALCLMLGVVRDPETRGYAGSRLQNLLDEFTVRDAKQLWSCLRESPRGLANYLDFRVDRTDTTPDLLILSSKARIAGPYAPHIDCRLAEAAYRMRHYPFCERFARQTLSTASDSQDRAVATYLLGSIAEKKGRRSEAMDRYAEVLRDYRASYVAQGARENLALLDEKSGRLGDALDHYFALGYEYDVAYMLDMRMSPNQIAGYLRDHPNQRARDEIRFALGYRYLREHRFARAAQTFRRVPAWKRKAYVLPPDDEYDEPTGLQDPLETAGRLGTLYHRLEVARGAEKRAAALLNIGNYYYSHRNLLLYNPRLWHGMRAESVGFSWNKGAASSQDDAALREHHLEHECLAQAMDAYVEIVERYPSASVRQRAAYRAACAAERLSNLNPYWRWLGAMMHLDEKATHLMWIATKGPDRSLARDAAKFAVIYAGGIGSTLDFKNGIPPRRYSPEY